MKSAHIEHRCFIKSFPVGWDASFSLCMLCVVCPKRWINEDPDADSILQLQIVSQQLKSGTQNLMEVFFFSCFALQTQHSKNRFFLYFRVKQRKIEVKFKLIMTFFTEFLTHCDPLNISFLQHNYFYYLQIKPLQKFWDLNIDR